MIEKPLSVFILFRWREKSRQVTLLGTEASKVGLLPFFVQISRENQSAVSATA